MILNNMTGVMVETYYKALPGGIKMAKNEEIKNGTIFPIGEKNDAMRNIL
jgi:hypothetical protein